MKTPSKNLPLKFQADARFTCASCGKCCRSGFQIPVESGTAHRIKNSSLYRDLKKEGYQPLVLSADQQERLSYDSSGACYFHTGQLCGLHAGHGLEHKPSICRMYPFNAVPTPDGVYISTLYSCPSVVAEHGELVEKQSQDLKALFGAKNHHLPLFPPVRQHILVTRESTVTWSQYKKLEERFRKGFEPKDPVKSLFYSACRLVRPDPERTVFQDAHCDTSELFEELFEPFVWQVMTYLEEIYGHPEIDNFFEGLQARRAVYSHRLNTEIPGFEILTPFKKSDRRAVERYVLNLLHGKRFVIGPSLVSRLLLVAASLAVLLFELSVRRKRREENALERAFEVCEERIVSQCNDLESLLVEVEEMLLYGE